MSIKVDVNFDPSLACTICHETLNDGKIVVRHNGRDGKAHPWHLVCGRPWVEKHNSCPACRKDITEAQLPGAFKDKVMHVARAACFTVSATTVAASPFVATSNLPAGLGIIAASYIGAKTAEKFINYQDGYLDRENVKIGLITGFCIAFLALASSETTGETSFSMGAITTFIALATFIPFYALYIKVSDSLGTG